MDVGYNFLVGEDGNAYEGRGWENLGVHSGSHSSGSIGICVLGDFTSNVPNSAAQNRVQALISCGVTSVSQIVKFNNFNGMLVFIIFTRGIYLPIID